jgi:hypothetical protein
MKMVNGFGGIEARIDPPAAKPACRCVLKEMAIKLEQMADALAELGGIEWKGRVGHKITDDIERVLDSYYTFSTCVECAPDKDGERCKGIGQGIV